jgi:hypothetical protein
MGVSFPVHNNTFTKANKGTIIQGAVNIELLMLLVRELGSPF